MSDDAPHILPIRDPVSGGPFIVTELHCDESGVSLRGRFALPPYVRLDEDQRNFLEVFLRCRGNLSLVEKEIGISYPTARGRLDGVLATLGFTPLKEESQEWKRAIIEQLERGEISAQEAKVRLRGKA